MRQIRKRSFEDLFTLVWFGVIFLLGFSPFFGFDLPASRVYYYLVGPASIIVGITLLRFYRAMSSPITIGNFGREPQILSLLLIGVLIFSTVNSTRIGVDHVLNSSRSSLYTEEVGTLVEWFNQHQFCPESKILVDYWNDERLQWVIASGCRTAVRWGNYQAMTYLVEDVKTDNRTKVQKLYQDRLDYEAIFINGNTTLADELVRKHQFHYIVTVKGWMPSFLLGCFSENSTLPICRNYRVVLETEHYRIFEVL
jgi:hypothetical protein